MDRNVVFYERRRRQEKDFFASGFFSSAPLSLGADQSDLRFFFKDENNFRYISQWFYGLTILEAFEFLT